MKLYFDTDYLSVRYDEVDRYLFQEWKTYPTSTEFREGMNLAISAMEHFNTGKVIFDLTKLGLAGILEEDKAWVGAHWYNRAVEAGYARVSFVTSSDFFSDMSVKDSAERIQNRIPTPTFNLLMKRVNG